MKALLTLLSTLILTDITISSELPAHSFRMEQIMVNEGKNLIEVSSSTGKEDLTCEFYYADATVKQQHTTHCQITTPDLSLPANIRIMVFNNEGHHIHYQVHAATILPLK